MTVQEAIEILKSKIRADSFDESFEEIQMDCALTMAIKALEKQIPKKVDTTGNSDNDFYICPVCKERLEAIDAFVLLEEPYCSNCGQKLDWGD